jgi:hypothetical protein
MDNFHTLSLNSEDNFSRNLSRFPTLGSEKDNQNRLDLLEQQLNTDFIRKPFFQDLGIKTSPTGRISEISANVIKAGLLQSTNWGVSAGSEYNLDDGTFRLGGSDAPKLYWNGTTLSITGSVAINAGSIDIGGADATSFHVDANGNHWAGASTYASGPFRVSSAGALVATSATITGAITATSGSFTGAISGSTIDIGGADSTSFHVDTSGNHWAGASTYASAPFKVSSAGALTATSATITGNISGSTITGSTLQTGTSGENTNITSSIITVRNNTTVTGTFRGYSGGGSYLNVDNAVVDSRITAVQVDTPEVVNYGASLTLETDGTHHIIISPSVDEADYIDRIVDVKGLVKILSTGNDKNLALYHNDTSGYISTSSGNLYLNAYTGRVGNMNVIFFGGMDGTLNATADGQIEMWTNSSTTDRFYARLQSNNVIVAVNP